jgi:EmrB/QacA subfamily drug resistance transporter
LLLGSLTSFVVGLDALVVTTALPTLHLQYGGGMETLSWTVNAYQLAFAATILTGSAIGDRYGRHRVFIAGIALFTTASALCALSPDAGLLIAFRALQGIGGGIAVPLSLALITDVTPPQRRGAALGIWGAVTGLAVATGPLVGGAIVEGLAWQWIFWLNVPLGIAIAVLAARLITSQTARRTAKLDLLGLVLAAGAVFGIAHALITGNDAGWSSPLVLVELIGGVGALVLFAVRERHTEHPMMPPAMFANRTFTAGCAAAFALMAGIFGLGFLTAQYLQLALHHSPLGVGLGLLPVTGLALVLSPLAGRVADRIGDGSLVALGLALQAAGLFLTSALTSATSSYSAIIAPLFLSGAGIAIAFPTVATTVLRSVSAEEAAIASGISNTFRQVGAVFGVAITTAVFTATGGYRSPAEFVTGYRPALAVLGALCLLGAVAGLAVSRNRIERSAAVPR